MASEVEALGKWARDPRLEVAVTGARPDRSSVEARRLAEEGCRVLLSMGVAGALSPELRPGSVIVPVEVLGEQGTRWPLSRNAVAQVEDAIGAAGLDRPDRTMPTKPAILGLDRMVLAPEDKARLFARTGALVVDTESRGVAAVAGELGITAAVLRVVGDPAERRLPRLVTYALGEDGRPRLPAVAMALLRRPHDLPVLLRVKRDTDVALGVLARAAAAAIPAMLDCCQKTAPV